MGSRICRYRRFLLCEARGWRLSPYCQFLPHTMRICLVVWIRMVLRLFNKRSARYAVSDDAHHATDIRRPC